MHKVLDYELCIRDLGFTWFHESTVKKNRRRRQTSIFCPLVLGTNKTMFLKKFGTRFEPTVGSTL